MDLAFLLRAERMLERPLASPAIDYGVLVATLAAHQSASAAARAAAVRANGAPAWPQPHQALAELLVAGPGWRAARSAQRGSFNPGAVNRT